MADLSLNLRIGSVFIILVVSAAGIAFPFVVASNGKESSMFRCLKAGAAGVMLGIALMHLLPDADEDLSEVYPDYSLAFALTAFGVVLNLTMEQAAVMYLASRKHPVKRQTNPNRGMSKASSLESLEHGEHCGFVKCEHGSGVELSQNKNVPFAGINSATFVSPKHHPNVSAAVKEVVEVRQDQDEEQEAESEKDNNLSVIGSDEGAEIVAGLMAAESLREIVSLYAMELSISVHSIIIGVDIGLLAGGSNLTTLVALICAIAFHQGVEGMGLGTVLSSVQSGSTSFSKVAVFIALFTCSTPVGIIIGICTSSDSSNDYAVSAKGTANALAAGSLLYLSLTEMVASYFASSDLARKPTLKMSMIGCFAVGIAFMAIIAIWA
mmetsp:Transcript_35593/g.70767  ORF Transcript_35593/g.70767 Transcript_35593/m.70767 type:complete len:381 (-) Transcript_35593:273-1415(-)|eukprot:CAMPEP_0170399330 /NCGR_PEP_ID=MMETSP0117_2-20130122/23901_1 /TAXON_ID=400756 /ORGANISM="Durinskia baltica, Strain CSIRO CS-38" /LENGTH=380 /DNA_ID=CAMNT_0010655993 /DNA_START=51 /DNA_END=1193 /DNA_ORIENTATION=-